METIVKYCDTLEQASMTAAGFVEEIIRAAVQRKGFCTVVLAGGRTPQRTYQILGNTPGSPAIPWEQCHFFWGDERWVAPDHPDSNYAMVRKALFAGRHIPPRNIHRIPTGNRDPETDAAIYEKHLRDFFQTEPEAKPAVGIPGRSSLPLFDLVLLGMGSDGHTASLFPGSPLLTEKKKWVAAVAGDSGSPPVPRITLTLPILNRAANVLFLIAGDHKRTVLETFLGKSPAERIKLGYPAALVQPGGRLLWIIAEED